MTTPALSDARVVPDGDAWTLIFIRDLRHPPEAVWAALTDPDELDRWAPFAASRDLGTTGPATLTMVDGDRRDDLPGEVRRVQPPVLLEYTWGDDLLRWELAKTGDGTRLTLRHTVADRDVSPFAAGWHICLDRMELRLGGADSGGAWRGGDGARLAGADGRVRRGAGLTGARRPPGPAAGRGHRDPGDPRPPDGGSAASRIGSSSGEPEGGCGWTS
jgi:uncharacterized protein YndB with AHSA1/START domain